ncbi:RING-H2 finger protein ATL73-like protein [Drosera capensis]
MGEMNYLLSVTFVVRFSITQQIRNEGSRSLYMVRSYATRLLRDDGSKASSGSYNSETNFDTNMVIILAALLCTLICALGLNSFLRCALRCARRLEFQTGEQAAGRPAPRGLRKSALRRLPVAVYSENVNMRTSDCAICLGEFVEGEKVRVLPKCRHGFHVRCIDAWLLLHSSCPTCRQSLLIGGGAATSDVVMDSAGME